MSRRPMQRDCQDFEISRSGDHPGRQRAVLPRHGDEPIKQRVGNLAGNFWRPDSEQHRIRLFMEIERQESAAGFLPAHHLSCTAYDVRLIPEIRCKVGTLVVEQAVACQSGSCSTPTSLERSAKCAVEASPSH
jgi:hypothetical protein